MKEGEPLRYLKKQIVDTVNSNIDDEALERFLRSSIKKLQGYVGYNIKKKLIDKYGDKSWVITMKMLSKPALQKGRDLEEKHEYIYIVENVAWIAGPSANEVHRTILTDYERNLPSTIFNPKLYSRRLPFLTNRYTQYYTPYPIAGHRVKPIQIYLTKNWYKVNSGDNSEVTQYQGYLLEVKDRHLGSWKGDIKASTPVLIEALKIEEAFYKLQEKLEDIYFIRPNNPSREDRERHAHIMKYMENMHDDPAAAAAATTTVTIANKPRNILEMSRAEKEAIEAEKEAKEEGEQPLFGTDGPNVFDDNSIPGEEPSVGEDPGAVPPTPEELDHNFNNDENPELEEEAEKESGEIESETEDREQVPEDAQTESTLPNKEYSISELMTIDRDIESRVTTGNSNSNSMMMEGDISPSII